MSSRTRLVSVLAVAAVILLTLVYLFRGPDASGVSGLSFRGSQLSPSDFPSDLDVVKRLDLSPSFQYHRQCIAAKGTKGVLRDSLTNISVPLWTKDTRVDWDKLDQDSAYLLPPCGQPISLKVPYFQPNTHVDTSALVLGVATTLSRIGKSLPELSRWLSQTHTTLVVLVVDQSSLSPDDVNLQKVQADAEALGLLLVFEPYPNAKDSEGLKNFALAQVLPKHRQLTTKWYGIIDDDTFFTSLPHVLDALSPYDPSLPYYIGALTERHYGVKKEGFKAWGGGGFFISPPLMDLLAEKSAICLKMDTGFGDILWRDCIAEVTSPTVRLTQLAGLNQIDLWGDLSGFYESGLNPLLSVHHWKSWHYHPIPMAHLVADVAGSETFLQRYRFSDDMILTNGFSVVQYPNGLPDLNLAEATMVEDVGITRPPGRLEFLNSLGRTRPALEEGKYKISWKFAYSTIGRDGNIRQFYLKRGNYKGDHGNGRSHISVDSLLEIDWKRA